MIVGKILNGIAHRQNGNVKRRVCREAKGQPLNSRALEEGTENSFRFEELAGDCAVRVAAGLKTATSTKQPANIKGLALCIS